MDRMTEDQKKLFKDSQVYNQVVDNNRKITKLLNESENLVANYFAENSLDYNPISNFCFFDQDDETTSIIIPKEYMWRDVKIEALFQLERLFDTTDEERIIRKNCERELQKISLYAYFLNRFKIYGGMRKIMYRDMIVGLTSVIEQIFKTGAIRILEHSDMSMGRDVLLDGSEVTSRGKNIFFKRPGESKWNYDARVTYDEWLRLYESKHIIPEFDPDYTGTRSAYVRYYELKQIRNKVHISGQDGYIMYDEDLNEEMVEKSILGVELAVKGIIMQMR